MKTEEYINGTFEFEPIKLHVITWMPEEPPKKVVHICHGMGEHAQRYEDFALYLNQQGIGVVVHDHRQHGGSVRDDSSVGIFGQEDTWENLLKDMDIIQHRIRNDYNCPMVIMGHSMGSVIARSYLQWTQLPFEKGVFSGVPDMTPFLWRIGIPVAAIVGAIKGDKPSAFMAKLSTGAFNKPFEPAQTPFEWLSSNPTNNQAYVEDPLCGYDYNPRFYGELSKGFLGTYDGANIRKMPKIPVLFVTGSADPVGGNRERMVKVFDHYKKHGLGHVASQMIFEGLRHEILNEVDHDQVYQFIVEFIEAS